MNIVFALFFLAGMLLMVTDRKCSADTVYLKNGRTIEGRIIEQNERTVRLEVNSGKITLPLAEIERIEQNSPEENARLQERWQRENEQWEQLQDMADEGRKEAEERQGSGAEEEKADTDTKKNEALLKKQKPASITVQRKNLGNSHYVLCIPPAYSREQKWPLLVVLHGLNDTPENMMNYWKTEAKRSGVIVVCPKSLKEGWEQHDATNIRKMISELKTVCEIDSEKVYLAGFSNGANYAMYLGLNHPELFAGIANVAGSIIKARRNVGPVDLRKKRNKKIPVLIIIGGKDDRERLDFARRTKQELEQFKYPVTYREFSNVPHVYMSWYSKEIIRWFKKL